MPILITQRAVTPVHHQVTLVVKGESCAVLQEILQRGINTWQRQMEPAGREVFELIEALKGRG